MTNQRTNRISRPGLVAMCIGVSVIVSLYFLYPCHRYFVDGLMYAIDLRNHPSWWVVHPHHIIYPLLPQVFFRTIGGTDSGLSELEYLLVWSMFAGTFATWGILMALRAGSISVGASIIGIGYFSFSRAVWYFAVTPNQNSIALALHVLTLLAIVIASRRLPDSPSNKNLVAISILTSLSLLSSQINAVLLLATGYLILSASGTVLDRSKILIKFLVITALITGGIYIIVGVVFSGLRSPTDFLDWQHSYVYQARWWASDFVDAVNRNWIGLTTVHVSSVFEPYGLFGDWVTGLGTRLWYINLVIRIAQAFVLLFLFFETARAVVSWIRTRKLLPLQAIGVVSALPIILFSCVWAPESSNYRILYIPGVFLFLVPSLQQYYGLDRFRFRRAWPVLLGLICLFGVNFSTQFLPQSNPSDNPYNYETYRLMEFVKEGDFILYSGTDEGHMRGLYAQYFINCDTEMAHELMERARENPEEVIDEFRERLESGSVVYIHEDAIYSEADIEMMNRNYDAGLYPGEIREFLRTWSAPLGPAILINRKQYFRLTPREPVPEIPLQPAES